MLLADMYSRCLARLRDFCSARNGNVAVTFAFATLPMIGLAGAAIDFSHANAVKVAMQAALDSTALMMSKNAGSMTDTELQTTAQKYFMALFNRPDVKDVSLGTTYSSTGGSSLVVSATASVPTDVMSAFGDNEITINAQATAKWGSSRLRVALVLDNTGSMADDNKMTALKTATSNLLSQLQSTAATDGDICRSFRSSKTPTSIRPIIAPLGSIGRIGTPRTAAAATGATTANRAAAITAGPGRWPITIPGTAASLIVAGTRRRTRRITIPTSPNRPPASRPRCFPPSNFRPARRLRGGSATIGRG
jgi:Flp pilus assembly protein TadG